MTVASAECRIDDCTKPVKDNEMCSMHTSRVRRHGDPRAFTHQKDRNLPRGETHHSWTGDDADYKTAHRRVRAKRGRASAHQCADCGGPARHWSYDHRDPNERVSAEGRAYSLDVNHYVPRCVRCHKRHDCALILQERGGTFNTAARCGKPIRSRPLLARLGNPDPAPVCGRPAGHSGNCSLPESYRRELEYNRRPAREVARSKEGCAAGLMPRCGHQIQVKRGNDPDTCGRPAGHNGGHLGTRAYRRTLDRNSGRTNRPDGRYLDGPPIEVAA